jgi:hypothetical protein
MASHQQLPGMSGQHSWNISQADVLGPVSPEDKQHMRGESISSGSPLPQQPPSTGPDRYQNQISLVYHSPAAPPDHRDDQVALNATMSQGFGTPSDWERFTPTETQSTGLPELSSTSTGNPQQGQVPVLQENSNVAIRPGQSQDLPLQFNVVRPMTQVLAGPNLGIGIRQAHNIANILPNDSEHRDSVPHRASLSSINGANRIQRSSTIDNVIEAWNTPLSQHSGPVPMSSTPQHFTDDRPISPPSQPQSPDVQLRSTRLLLQEPAPLTAAADPYKDLDPEYHSSLTRYLKMLRKESLAPSEEEKYKIFQSFMQKELRIRKALYSRDPEAPLSKSPSQLKQLSTMQTVEEVDTVETDRKPVLSKTPSQVIRKPLRSESIKSLKPSAAVSDTAVKAFVQSGKDISLPAVTAASGSNASAVKAFVQSGKDISPPAVTAASGSNASAESSMSEPVFQIQDNVQASSKLTGTTAKDQPSTSKRGQPSVKLAKILTSSLTGPGAIGDRNQGSNNAPEDMASKSLDQPPSHHPFTPPRIESPKMVNATTPGSNDSSYVIVNQDDEHDAYSPGGRPLMFRPKQSATGSQSTAQNVREPSSVISTELPKESLSPGSNAPMVIEDYVVRDPTSPGAFAPIAVDSLFEATKPATSNFSGPVKFEPPRPVYTPFRYSETSQKEAPRVLIDRPADEEYSTLRNQATESGRFLSHETNAGFFEGSPQAVSPTNSRQEHQETFLGIIRRQSKAMRRGSPVPNPSQLRVGTPLNTLAEHPIMEAVSALRGTLPSSLPQHGHLHEKIDSINQEIESCPDEFGYIKESVASWDRVNREVRKAQDEERDKRQTESGVHIDELFNSNEISYADINGMEEDFKLAEAERKYQEDQQELQSFIDSVYIPITQRIQHEISTLTPNYILAIDLLDRESDAGSRLLNSHSNRVQMTAAMDLVLHVFRKLEIRYLKLAEARYERERRSKTLELGVLYTNGNTTGIKSLEQEFTAAEKLQVLDEAQEKDKRANRLVDFFDRATVRGLGDNQTYVDDLLSKVRKLSEAILKDGRQSTDGFYDADEVRQTLSAAQEALDFVLADSKTILTKSNAADNILNEADYMVSVSKAKVTNADKLMFQKLQEERSREESKIVDEMVARMDSMAKGPTEATILIQEILAKIGDNPDQHQERIKRALEEAKKRNAAKEG